jgi:hypothetical protein
LAAMTLEELTTLIKDAPWFQRLTERDIGDVYVQISSLAPRANVPTGDEALERLADQMDWLPSSRDQADPIHGQSLEQRAESLGKKEEYSQRSLKVCKAALSAMRAFPEHPVLRSGPHDFTETARGAATYAARRAAYEILLGAAGFWCNLIRVYHAGHWPCGILPDGQVVVL